MYGSIFTLYIAFYFLTGSHHVFVFQSDKEIFSLLGWNRLQNDPLVMFEDGSSMFVAEIFAASENKRVKRRRTAKSSQE